MKKLLALGALLTMVSSGLAQAESSKGPVVVELFTSQSCYSCPPAEVYLGELAQKPNLIALEYHVDYWDDLVYGSAGRWKDVHSSPAYTARQRIYAGNLPGGQSYTPQMVIDGQDFAVGSRRWDVSRKIKRANRKGHRVLDVAVSKGAADSLTVGVDGKHGKPAEIWLVRFTKEVTTRVRAGENKGKTLTNHNIVTEMKKVGDWQGQPVTVAIPNLNLKPTEGCAVLVQTEGQGPIIGAGACPGVHS